MCLIGWSNILFGVITTPLYYYFTPETPGWSMWNEYGFLGGRDGGWTYRLVLLMGFYFLREMFTMLCLKRFDALIKNLCNAGASLATYVLAVTILEQKTFVLKRDLKTLLLILVVIMEVFAYSLSKRYKPEPKKA